MQLGENELIESIRSIAKGRDFKKDGRRAPRIDRTGKARIQIDGAGPILTVSVRNYSPRGIGLIHTSKLTVGQQFVLILPRNDQPAMRILCTIAHVQPLSGGEVFAIGAEFTLVLGEAKPPAAPVPVPVRCAHKVEELERIRSSILS